LNEPQHTPNRRYYDLMAWLLLGVIAVDLAVIVYRKYSPADLKVDRTTRVEFPLQVDPNTAGAFDLQCVPGINKKMAQAIIEYRTEYQSRFPGRVVFPGPEALKRIKGISEKKLLQLIPYLTFPKPNPQTRPNSP
jgi:DNA uptake protein ComE-like DNA-binding protein